MSKKGSWRKILPGFKKNFVRIMALTLAGLMIIATLVMALIPTYGEGARDQYTLSIRISDTFRGAQITQTVRYVNRTEYALDAVIFNIQANAYRRSTTVPIQYEQLTDAYPAGFTPGGVELYSVEVNGAAADFGVSGDGEEFLRVACDLKSGESAEFSFRFDLALPWGNGVLGASADEFRLFGFYPQVCVFDAAVEDFTRIAPTAFRDITYADMADYSVVIEAPEIYDLAAPGAVSPEGVVDGYRRWSVEAENVRDFSATLSRRYRTREGRSASGTQVRIMSGNRLGAARALSAAVKALDIYAEWFGPYPYSQLVIAGADMPEALSHSGFIALPNVLFAYGNRGALEHEIAYQVARQWFGLSVGSNPQLEPWLDDSVCSYLALMYYEAGYGYEAFKREVNAQVLPALQITLPGGVYVDSTTNYFTSKQEYTTVIRDRGAAVMHEIRDVMGGEAFLQALRAYAGHMANGIASIGDLSGAISQAAGKDMNYFIMEMLRNIGSYANQVMEEYVQ